MNTTLITRDLKLEAAVRDNIQHAPDAMPDSLATAVAYAIVYGAQSYDFKRRYGSAVVERLSDFVKASAEIQALAARMEREHDRQWADGPHGRVV